MTPAPRASRPVYEHPWFVRFCHWTNAIALSVLVASGLMIFSAFPSFGPKVPEHDLIEGVPPLFTLGGWLGGALQWHFTFMWIFAAGGIAYVLAQFFSGHVRTVLFNRRDIVGVWPMVRHYFLFGPKPAATAQYNALQKLAYTSAVLLGALQLVTGAVMYKPAQFSTLGLLLGGYHRARLLHFLGMCGLLAFIPGHLIMVALHGWDNLQSMLTGWKMSPEYDPARAAHDQNTAN
jgi:Ni/Fe-hydrogenase b-type cytochrome subunit